MSDKKVVVVFRQLNPELAERVVSSIHSVPNIIHTDMEVDHYAVNVMKDDERQITNKFPEFKQAKWTYEIHPLHSRYSLK